MTDFLIIDTETLSNIPYGATLLSLAGIAGKWDQVTPDNIQALKTNAFYMTFKTKRQVTEYGSHVSKSTLDWWEKQSEDARAVLSDPNKVEIENIKDFNRYCSENGVTHKTTVLIRAPHFDQPIIDFFYSKLGLELPYSGYKIRDVRSIIDTACGTDDGYVPMFRERIFRFGLNQHHAVDDCIKDLLQVKMAVSQDFSWIED